MKVAGSSSLVTVQSIRILSIKYLVLQFRPIGIKCLGVLIVPASGKNRKNRSAAGTIQ